MARHILIADDDLLFRELLIARLEGTEFTHDVATDGVEALAMTTQRTYHLLLLDLRMPRLDGLLVLEAIRANPRLRATRVIVLTASRSDADIAEVERLGVDSYLSKPINIERLVDRMRIVLDPDSTEARKTWLVEDYSEEDFVLRC